MNIKVCGITSIKQLQQLDGLDIAMAGLIFHKESPRYAGDKISGRDVKSADLDTRKVGVFVDSGYEAIMKTVKEYDLDMVQLHGDETPELCDQLSSATEVIKVFKIKNSDTDIDDMLAEYDAVCDYYLFDTAGKDPGGNGIRFDWDIIAKSRIEKPFFLSGGIGPEDVQLIKKFKHPDFYAVDINSRFEKEPGVKDMGLVLGFKQAFRIQS